MIVRSRHRRFDHILACEIGGRVQRLRVALGLSRTDVMVHTGLGARTLDRIERGDTLPGSAVVLLLADALQSSPDEILGWRS